MTASVTGEKFLDILRRSGLVAEASLADYAGHPTLANDAHAMATALIRNGLLTPFQAKLLLAGKYRGLMLGNYKLLDQIGRGGMGTVYLAEHTSLKRKAAVKVLSNDQAGTTIGMERFYREAQSAAALDHPNIVKVYDVGQYGNVHYIAMEYIEGRTLAQMIEANGPLHFATAADYIAQAAAGLQEAGDRGFVHRDIKPENLIVDRSGTLKILDMGLTRVADESEGHLTAVIDPDSVVGTPDYIAPEQALNQPVDIRTDIYSLGVTFYALLTGKPPFGGTTAQKLLQHQLKDAPSLNALRSKAPPEIEPILVTMMAKKPDDRYQQPADVIEALAPWLSQSALAANQSKTVGATLTRLSGRTSTRMALANQAAVTPKPRSWLLPAIGAALGVSIIACVSVAVAVSSGGTKPGDPAGGNGAVAAIPDAAKTSPPLPNVTDLPPLPAGALLVAADGPQPHFATIAEALATLKPGEKKLIVVRNPVHSEQLTLTGAKHSNVTIESGFPQHQVTWLAPANSSDKAMLELNGVEGVRVRGFKFDGQNRVSDAIRVSGKCPDLVVEDATLVGFSRAGVSVSGAVGFEDRPVTFRKLRAIGGSDSGVGVQFDTGELNSYVKILDSRFEGPLAAGIAVSGPTINLEVRRNRFYRTRAGVHYQAAVSPVPFTAQIRSNTFYETATGIEFASIPATPAGQTAGISVLDNLFLSTKRLAMLAGTVLAPDAIPGWYWTPEKNTSVPAEPRYFRAEFKLDAKPAGPVTLNVGVDESFTVWVNGKEVGKSTHDYFSQRVYAFDVTADLVAGVNAVAIEGNNKVDPFSPGFATAAAFLVKMTEGTETPKTLLTSDDPWKSSKVKGDNWTKAGFDDAKWVAPKAWADAQINFPWRETVWDSTVDAHWKGEQRRLRLTVDGNVRDYFSPEGYPVLETKRTTMVKDKVSTVGLDPQDDDTFLRYPPGHRLATGGATQGPVGVPPAGQ